MTLFETSPCIYAISNPHFSFEEDYLIHIFNLLHPDNCVIYIIPGGLLCCLSTLPHLSEGLSSDSKFNLALVGQALTGIACPFISCVPTKISQHWFNDEQRALATILLGKNKSIIGLAAISS